MGQRPEEFCCIAIDMGAGSIRVMLGLITGRGISYREIHRIQNRTLMEKGHERWEMDRITGEILEGIGKSVQHSRAVPVSIGVDSWGVDFVLLDSNGKPVESPVSYRDSRTEGMREKWAALMPEMETFRRTGINFYLFNTLFQLLSMQGSEQLKKSERLLFIPSYINYLLSGRAVNEVTIASTSQMLGVKGDQWDSEILGRLQLERGILGELVMPGTLLGKLTAGIAGAERMQNIAVCGHDTACVVTAIPAGNENFAYISAGTWCIVGIESRSPLVSEEACRLGFTNELGYNLTYRTLKNIVGLWLLQGLKKALPPGTTFSEMEKMTMEDGTAAQVIDPDYPGFYNPEDMKKAFDSCFRKSGQPIPTRFGQYIRCAYDSICFSIRYHVEKLEMLSGKAIPVLHLVGGGSQSAYLNQRIATICEREVVSGPVEGAVLGNILVQAIAMGRIGSLEEGRLLVKDSCQVRNYLPGPADPDMLKRYEMFLGMKQT